MPKTFSEQVEALTRWRSQIRTEYMCDRGKTGQMVKLTVDSFNNFYVTVNGKEVWCGLQPYQALKEFNTARGIESAEGE